MMCCLLTMVNALRKYRSRSVSCGMEIFSGGKSVSSEMEIFSGGKRLVSLRVLVVTCLACVSTVRTQQSPQRFLSIDCGSDVSYYDNNTGIYWEADAKYISTGKNQQIAVASTEINERQSRTARVFDASSHTRNCYVLPVVSGETYLLRATFFAGNVTDHSQTVAFVMWMDNNWANQYVWYPAGSSFYKSSYDEFIYSPSRSNLNLCIVLDPAGLITFISALELRQLARGMYASILAPTAVLQLANRSNFGPNETSTVKIWRYPDDAYDRIWTLPSLPSNTFTSLRNSSISLSSNSIAHDPDQAPLSVMEDAWVVDGSSPIVYTFDSFGQSPVGIYTAAYFEELDGNAFGNNVRGMNYYLNDSLVQSFNVTNEPLEIHLHSHSLANSLNISFTKAAWSSFSPILNAFELYTTWTFNTSTTAAEDVSAIEALKDHFNLTDWTGDPCLPASTFDWLDCNDDSSSTKRVTKLVKTSLQNTWKKIGIVDATQTFLVRTMRTFQLHGVLRKMMESGKSRVRGNIPLETSNLTAMTDLLLNNNSFNGSIPDFSALAHLQNLRLENNNLSGPVPSYLLTKPGLDFSYAGNPGLFIPRNISAASSKTKASVGAVVGGILGGLAAVAIVSTIILYMFFTRKRRADAKILKVIEQAENPYQLEFTKLRKTLAGSLTSLTLQEVSNVTKKFSKKLGEGSFGPVYYGRLPDGTEVAVKVKSADSRQGETEFFNEVEVLSRIHHRNLVSLVGFCEDANQQILIYVYVSNGALRDHLYGDKSSNRLDWITRLDIALNAARGLQYLHTDCEPRIIHRDVKSTNILLDHNMMAKVADFGISKQAPEGMVTGVDTLLKGTFGYMDPEYFDTQRLTQKSNVYSFGVVLLEIISGRSPYFAVLPDGTSGTLIQWVRSAVKYGSPMDIVDPLLKGEFDKDSMTKAVSLAISCIDPQTATRPEMDHVVRTLTDAIQLEPFSKGIMSTRCDSDGSIADGDVKAREHFQDSEIYFESPPGSNDSTIISPR